MIDAMTPSFLMLPLLWMRQAKSHWLIWAM
jgi:hypothetical protein